jgi:hypothetical protein
LSTGENTKMQNNLLPNREAIKSHLNQLFGGAKDGLIEVAYTPSNSKAVNQAEFFNVNDIEKAVDFIVKVNSQDGVNTYVGAALRNPDTAPFMRSSNEDYYLSNYVWADLDDADSAKNAKEKYKDLPPSFVVVTGRHPDLRAQVWWKLAAPEQDKGKLKHTLAHVCSALDGDKAVVDPARVMRVGGSIAWPKKDGRIPELTEFIIPSSRADSVSIDDLTSHYPLADSPVDKPQSASGAVGLFSPPKSKLFHDNQEWSVEDIERLLEFIHPDNEYLGWVKVGMALKDYGLSFQVWDKWSQTGAKYDAKIMRSKWDSFKGAGTTIGSLVYQAKQGGWQPNRFEPFVTPVMQENHIPDTGNMVETVNQETGEVTYKPETGIPVTEENKRVLPLIYADEVQPVTHCTDFVEDLLRDNEFSVIYGASNCGKTFFMLDLAMHVALGKEWRGKEVEQGGVIYAALEGGHGTKNRIVAFKNHYQITDKIPLAIIPSNINFLDGKVDMPAFLDAIEGAKKRLGKVRLIVVDTLARAISGGDENSGQDMGQLIINADKLREMTNAHIAFVHHSGKDDLKGARGHSSLRAAVDTEIEVSRPDTESPSTIKIVKQREMEMIDDMSFSLSRVVLGVNERGKEVTSCVVMPCEVVEKKTTARMNPIQTFMYDAILDCMDRFGEIRFVQKDMPNVKSIRYEELREVLEMRGLKGMMEQEKKSTAEQVKSATQTARVALKKMGKINFNGVYVWLVS